MSPKVKKVSRRAAPVQAPVHDLANDFETLDLNQINQEINAVPQVEQPGQVQQQFKSPLQINPVNDALDEVQLNQPDYFKLDEAYQKAKFENIDSDKKRKSILQDSNKKYQLQTQLRDRINAVHDHPVAANALSLKKAISCSDEHLISHYGAYNGESEAYLNIRYNLMKNRYYALLPVKDMRKSSRLDLLQKLRAEYEKEPAQRNRDLITFYQDLIRLRIIEDAAAKKTERNEVINPPEQISETERTYNDKAFSANSTRIDSLHLSQEDKTLRKAAMKRVMKSENGEEFWSDKTEDEMRNVTPAQKEGVRSILAWMYRNCNKSSETKEPFVYKLTQARPSQLLMMFYIIENGLQQAPTAECFYKAKSAYVPNLETFKGRMVASKAKFWKRIGSDTSDSVIDWCKLGQAAKFALGCEELNEYEQYEVEEAAILHKIENPESREGRSEEDLVYDLLLQKGNKLLTLYRAAGLSFDMPSDLIEDLTLRQKITSTLDEFRVQLIRLDTLRRERLSGEGAELPEEGVVLKREGSDYSENALQKKAAPKGIAYKDEEPSGQQIVNDTKTVVSAAMTINTLLTVIGKPTASLTKNINYVVPVSGISGAFSVVGLISSMVSAAALSHGSANLSAAQHTSKGLSVAGSFISNATGMVKDGATITGKYINLGTMPQASSWIGNTSITTAKESFKTVTGGIKFCTGATTILAGGLMTAAGSIEMARADSSKRDLRKARAFMQLNASEEGDLQLTEEELEQRRQNRENLESLVKHREKMASNQKTSGTVQMIGGIMTMIGGALTMTGLLAPIGGILGIAGTVMNISMGILYARHKRNLTRRQAVDDGIKLDAAVDLAKATYHDLENVEGKELVALRDQLRQEILAELNYATYKECFYDMSKKNAEMLYHHVFEMPEETTDYKMHLEVMRSLGFKKISRAHHPWEKNYPPAELIFNKLME